MLKLESTSAESIRAETTRAKPTLIRAESSMMREAEGVSPAVREAPHESSMASEAAVMSPVVSEVTLGFKSDTGAV